MASQAKLREVPPPETLSSAMAAAFAEIDSATKTARNPHFKSKYADITAVIEAIKPALINHGLYFTQRPEPSERGVTIETVIGHASGQELSLGKLFVPANKNDAQGFGSALTYARRYALVTAFGVPVEDDDGNAAARGQSKESAVSPSQPSDLKAQLEQSVEDGKKGWREPGSAYSTPTALHKIMCHLDHELNGCGDSEMVYGVTARKDWKEFVRIGELHMPHYLHGGDPAPPEFEGLVAKAERLVREFDAAEANNITDMARA